MTKICVDLRHVLAPFQSLKMRQLLKCAQKNPEDKGSGTQSILESH